MFVRSQSVKYTSVNFMHPRKHRVIIKQDAHGPQRMNPSYCPTLWNSREKRRRRDPKQQPRTQRAQRHAMWRVMASPRRAPSEQLGGSVPCSRATDWWLRNKTWCSYGDIKLIQFPVVLISFEIAHVFNHVNVDVLSQPDFTVLVCHLVNVAWS